MEFIIQPYIGVGPITFEMSRTEVRKILGVQVKEFKKSPMDDVTTDAFHEHGIFVYYNMNDVCEAVELTFPALPIFQGNRLLKKPFRELREYFECLDKLVEIDSTGLISYQFGIGVYAPFAEDYPDEPVEGIIVFERGYYDAPESL